MPPWDFGNDIRRYADSLLPANTEVINFVSDLPDPTDTGDGLGMLYRLEAKAYNIGAHLTLPYPILGTSTAGERTVLFSENYSKITFTQSSGGCFVSNSTTNISTLFIWNLGFVIDSGAVLFEIDGFDRVQFVRCDLLGNGGLGTIKNGTTVFLEFFGFNDFTSRLTIEDAGIYMSPGIFNPGASISDALMKITGNITTCIMSEIQTIPYSSDAAFDFTSLAANTTVTMDGVTLVKAEGGIPFKSGSPNQKDPRITVTACPGISPSTIVGGFYTRGNETGTDITIQGVTKLYQSAEQSGSNTQINTTDTTGFSNGDDAWFPNSIYAGKYTISSLVPNTSFEINKTFISTDAGEYHRGWTKIAGTTIENEHVDRTSMTDNNELTLSNLEATIVKNSFDYTVEGDATADKIEVCIMKDDNILSESIKERKIKTDEREGVVKGLAEGVAGDPFTVYVRNMDSSTRDVLFSHFNFITTR